jgi:solute carrier family 35 protein E3
MFAFLGVFFSSLYTVWISAFRRRLNMTSMQLLFNQAPISAFMLLYVIPFVDTFPVWGDVSLNRWVLILLVSAQSLPGEGVLLTSHPSLASLPS